MHIVLYTIDTTVRQTGLNQTEMNQQDVEFTFE